MAPKRARPEATYGPRKRPKAVQTLDEEGILNGLGLRGVIGGRILYYKNQGCSDATLEACADYILHCPKVERLRLLDALLHGGTTIDTCAAFYTTYRAKRDALANENRLIVARAGVLILDSDGVMH